MSVSDKSIDPRILESAKEEFLSHGFETASLNLICQNAGVTTGALYKRYNGKEELFAAVVADTVSALDEFASQRSVVSPKALTDAELISIWEMNDDGRSLLKWFEFLENRREEFVLLINCSAGTRYEKFQHDWVEKMCSKTYDYYEELVLRGLADESITIPEMHILMTAFWSTVYEPFIHGYDIAQIKKHCEIVCRLFDWSRVFKFNINNKKTPDA